jgi:hypothetical protein
MSRAPSSITLAVVALVAGCSAGPGPGPTAGPLPGGSTAQLISEEGGTVTTPDGVSINVPAGALSTSIFLTVLPDDGRLGYQPSRFITVDGGAAFDVQLVGTAYLLGPRGTEFSLPVTVTLPFDPSKLPVGASISNVSIVTAASSFVGDPADAAALTTTPVDETHVSGETPHFSIFAPAIITNYVTPCANDFNCASGQTCVAGGCVGG